LFPGLHHGSEGRDLTLPRTARTPPTRMHAARISYARAGPAPPRPRSARRRMLGSSNTDSFQPAQRLAPVILDVEPSYQSHGAIIARFSGQPLGSSLSWRADSPPASWTPPTWRHQLQPRLHRAPYHRTPKCGPACCSYPPGRGRAPKRPRRDIVAPQLSERLSRLENIINQLGVNGRVSFIDTSLSPREWKG
jgi:hypothetical protein